METPVQVDINPDDHWTVSHSVRTENIGVENLTLRGNWQDNFIHHNDAVHDSGWSMLNRLFVVSYGFEDVCNRGWQSEKSS